MGLVMPGMVNVRRAPPVKVLAVIVTSMITSAEVVEAAAMMADEP